MKLFRNPEYRKEFLLYLLLSLVFTAGAFFLRPLFGFLMLFACLCFLTVHSIVLYRRYQRIAQLSDEIDRILHGESEAEISVQTEGELSILQNEIRKMTVRLMEQTELLRTDKKRLSEAIEDIFHQLRTPLTSMNLSVEMLRSRELSTERRMQIARELTKSLERIRWQVDTLLKISKIDAGAALFRADNLSVSELVDRAAEQLLIPMELREQQFIRECGDAQLSCDLLWTAEALGNILKNAVEHTPEGGEIRITAQESPIYTEIIIADNGPGFDPEEIPHLFERFFKGKNAGSDSIGIGLALARMIITDQNGTITASNRDGGGACFTIRFYKSVV